MDFIGNSFFVFASVALSVLIGIPAWSLLVLTLAACGRKTPSGKPLSELAEAAAGKPAPRTVVLVPAHNESQHMVHSLQCLKAQLSAGDRLLVVADNCSDDTAVWAARAGAEVIERHDPSLRGKGYALAFGVESLRSAPPDVLIVVDADCTVSLGGIQALAQQCHASGRPVQMLDLMQAPSGAGLRTRIMEFAWTVKNKVRPLGSFRLGDACHLMGTGMALPWPLAAGARLATGHIAEDMKLGVDMALAGRPAQFMVRARVTSEFPLDASVARGQKARWEHGHLTTLKEELPRLLWASVRQRSKAALVLAMDLLIPPLALYFMTVVAALMAFALLSALQPALAPALWVALASAGALAVSVLLAWLQFCRHLLNLRELLSVPLYAAWKVPVYLAYFLNQKSGWIKTARKV